MCTKVTYRGWRMCSDMPPTIEMFEDRMRKEQGWASGRYLQIFQGAFNTSVSQSADTHAGGGALDTEKLNDAGTLIARECGTTSWQRGTPQDTYFDDHNHWIWIGCGLLSSGASGQVDQYYAGCNGLSGWGPDQSPRPKKIVTCQQALADYNGGGGTDEGLFGMTDKISKYRGASRDYTTNNWNTTIATDDDGGATIATNTKGMCDVVLSVTGGLARDDEIGVRWQYLGTKGDSTNIDWQSQPIDLRSNGGTDRFQVVCHFDLKPQENGWDHKLRLAVNTGGKKVTFGTVETKGWQDKS